MSEDSKSGRKLALWLGIPFLLLVALAAVLMVQNRPPVVNVPARKMPNPNGWDDFVLAGDIASKVRPAGPYSGSKESEKWTIPELQAFVTAQAPALSLMRQGLTKQCAHPPLRADELGFRESSKIRELARVISGEALYYQRIGKAGRAVESLLDGVEIGVLMQRGATLIGGVIGTAIESIPTRRVEGLLQKLSPQQLASSAKRMEKMSKERVPFSDILIEESRVNAVREAQMLRNPGFACDWCGWFCSPGASRIGRVGHSISFAFTDKASVVNENRAYLEAVAKEQRGPYTGKSTVRVPSHFLPFASGLESYVHVRATLTNQEAIFTILQTQVALLRYRNDHGRYPSKLSDVTPAYLTSVPADPFGQGRPLRYRSIKGGKSFVLYSVGSDMQDDGGKPLKDPYIVHNPSIPSSTYNPSPSPGDLVAGHLSE